MGVGVYDFRKTNGEPANSARWAPHRHVHGFHFLEYISSGSLKNALMERVNRTDLPVDPHPYGQVNQDNYGTARGCWFNKVGLDGFFSENPDAGLPDATNIPTFHLGLVNSNLEPLRTLFSVGPMLPSLNMGIYEFKPKDTGYVDRQFDDVVPGGEIYAYDVEEFEPGPPRPDMPPLPRHEILLSMPDSDHLLIKGFAPGQIDFANPGSWPSMFGGAEEFIR